MADRIDGISVVIPVYNSEHIIEKLHQRLTETLYGYAERYEIILVNDCSPDNVWEKILVLCEKDMAVKGLSLRKNVGYDNAIMAGLNYVSYPKIIIMDDDLQHSPEYIPKLVEKLGNGFDIVYGQFLAKKQTPIKNFGSWLNGQLARFIIGKPKDLYLSPFKALKREIAEEAVQYGGPFPYVDGLFFQITSSIGQIPLEHHQRDSGTGGHGIFRSLRIMLNFCTTFSIIPLRVFTLSGFLVALSAGFFSAVLILWKIFGEIDVEGWASLLLAILVFSGIQLMGLGILGEYVGRSYMNINRKPQFVLKEIKNIDMR